MSGTTAVIDIRNLETASDYINNLLLSRGLLRNGEPISFAHPSQDEGGKQATISKVINLVHDLILRRDRESDTLTKLSHDIATSRSTSIQQTQAIQKLEAKNADLERQLALKSAAEKTAASNLKIAEMRNKTLKEDMIRLKGTISQIRAQCANDVRKKETELKKLQKYLEPKRGREGSVQVGITMVNPGASLQGSMNSQGSRQRAHATLQDDATEYLTGLAQQLSVENESLRALTKSTTSTLRELQGIPDDNEGEIDGSTVSQISLVPCETLQADLSEVLNHLQTLLTSPSFVPMEEVQIREDEIVRLREGWEKMESRWREALTLMHGWRKRMMETGDAINLDDLRRGLVLGSTPITMPPPSSTRKGRFSIDQLPSPDDSIVDDKSASMSLDQQEDSLRAALDANAPTVSPVKDSASRLGTGLFPAPKVLRPTTGNTQRIPPPKRRSIELEEGDSAPSKQDVHHKRQRIDQNHDLPEIDDFLAAGSDYEAQEIETEAEADSDHEEAPQLSIEEKLSQAKREADMVSEALRKAMMDTDGPEARKPAREDSKRPISSATTRAIASSKPDVVVKPVKRTKVPIQVGAGTMKRSKRRSTLLPEELQGLIGA